MCTYAGDTNLQDALVDDDARVVLATMDAVSSQDGPRSRGVGLGARGGTRAATGAGGALEAAPALPASGTVRVAVAAGQDGALALPASGTARAAAWWTGGAGCSRRLMRVRGVGVGLEVMRAPRRSASFVPVLVHGGEAEVRASRCSMRRGRGQGMASVASPHARQLRLRLSWLTRRGGARLPGVPAMAMPHQCSSQAMRSAARHQKHGAAHEPRWHAHAGRGKLCKARGSVRC